MATLPGNARRKPAVLDLAGLALLVAAAALNGKAAAGAESSVSPRELFRLGGIDDVQLGGLADHNPWQEADHGVLRTMLYRMAQDVRPPDMEHWSHGQPDLALLAEEPGAYRMEVFTLRGLVLRAEPYTLAASSEEPAPYSMLWRCRLRLDQGGLVEIFSAKVPRAWKQNQAIEEPAGSLAFFLSFRNTEAGSTAIFLTDRVAWYPATYLGQLGMDVGLLDDVRVPPPPKKNAEDVVPEAEWESRRLTATDHECFYQMLAAVGRAKPGQLSRWAEENLKEQGRTEYSVVPLFNEPEHQQGKLVELRGIAKRILPVRVDDDDVMERFGISQYYQVYLFTGDSQDNPLVFCLRKLPSGLATGDGPNYGEELTVPGFFFKTWSYRNAAPATDGKVQRQLAPLLVGDTAVWHPAGRPPLSFTARTVGTVLLLAVLGGAWLLLRRSRRGDREFERRVWRRRPAEMSEMEWEQIGEAPRESAGDPDEAGPAASSDGG